MKEYCSVNPCYILKLISNVIKELIKGKNVSPVNSFVHLIACEICQSDTRLPIKPVSL